MPELAAVLDQRLSAPRLRLLRRVGEAAGRLGADLYLVGGTVRDLVLGADPKDLDLSFVGPTERIESDLAPSIGATVDARSEFGTLSLAVGGERIDVATARSESYAHPGALPEVSRGSICDDLARRDFSINAMGVGLTPSSWGTLTDPFGGRDDAAVGVVRVLHSDSFADDPTRILRAVRYSRRLGFELDVETEALLRRDLRHLRSVSGDRVRREIEHILREPRAASMLEMAQSLGVLGAVHPSLELSRDDLARLQVVEGEEGGDGALLFAAMVGLAVAGESLASVVSRLNVSVDWARVAEDTVRLRGDLHRLGVDDMAPSQVFDALKGIGPVAVEAWALLSDNPLVVERLGRFESEMRHASPHLDGHDLIALGVKEGPLVGQLLAELLHGRLDGDLETVDDERRYVLRRIGGEQG